MNASEILELPGLVSSENGIHLIKSGGNPLILWALLGKLYPENVVVLDIGITQELAAAIKSGKGFGVKFLIHLTAV